MKPQFTDFLKKYNLLFGILSCLIIMLDSLLILLIGTGNYRLEFNFLTHMVIPTTVGKFFILFWCLHYWTTREYDKSINTFTRNLFFLTIINMIITFFDYEMYLFFLVQSVTSLFLTILMCLLVNQRRFAIRSKKYAARLYVINIFLYMCIAAFIFIMTTSFENYYVFLLIFTIVTQICMIVALISVHVVEKKFKESLLANQNDSDLEEYSD